MTKHHVPVVKQTVHKDEPLRLAGREGSGKITNNTRDCADALGPAQADPEKTFATLRARLALAGWSLLRTSIADGPAVYIACRWNMPRELASLQDVAEFADRVGAPS